MFFLDTQHLPCLNTDVEHKTALFASWFTYGLSGVFWLFMNKGLWFSSPRKIALTALNVTIVAIAAVLVSVLINLLLALANLLPVWSWSLGLRKSSSRRLEHRKFLLLE